jgi:four helix bundle protein
LNKEYSFERLEVWKDSRELVKLVYSITIDFPKYELYGLTSQIRRAVISISSNISEGSGRTSINDQKHFYKYAFSSLMEVLNQAILANDLDYLNDESLSALRFQIDKIANKLNSLSKSLDKE